ncbi:type IX secretion system membrane protein, PorP/SprF family [Aquiflexum balticum DSM 16537]|uniref:Type IX secretion system membrane protein, PorP/SprF family n=1 Tax=Aquiflexum balticum DSM 16537 TaxID=758820 RepID=A0A1W2H8D5_9BACT|nr:type IX secretion system membrane protein PorP/SprF [Aquiflexum balticum]SMD44952.1 type IX secretion system membrane protein, PorP/SprF family [Aquiflexum balticum DSM 16537]
MKTTLKISGLTIAVILFAMTFAFSQQLPQFSQYIFNGLHINPAYAGYKNEGYVQSTYRSQWVGFEGAPTTFTVTADLSANEGLMGFGASVMSDKIGPTSTTTGLITYAYRIQTGRESFFSLGASAGVSQYVIDGDMLKPLHQNDGNIPTGIQNMMTPNMNLGLFFHSNKFYAGLSAYNLIGKAALEREDVALAFHDVHFYLTAGVMIPVTDNIQFKPSFLVKEVKGSPTNYDINGMLLFMDRLWLGASYRSNVNIWNENLEASSPTLSNRNAVAFITEFFATPNLRIGYAYDQNLNVLQDMRTNSHEISLGYYLSARKVNMKNPRYF